MLYSGERKRGNKEQNPKERLSQVASRKATVAPLKPCYISKIILSPKLLPEPSLLFEAQKVSR